MKWIKLALLVSCTILVCASFILKGTEFTEEDRIQIGDCWFESPYSYMFDYGNPVEINGKEYGRFRAGIGGIMFYGSLDQCLQRLASYKGISLDGLEPFEALSGEPLQKSGEWDHSFKNINPKIVRWGYENLIPDPKSKVGGAACQLIYDRVFYRFFRVMTKSYLYLDKNGIFDQETFAYIKDTKAGADGIDWLNKRYSVVGSLIPFELNEDGTNMTVPMAVGFWLRRHADGSDKELWKGLTMLMEKYDKDWLKKAGDDVMGVTSADVVLPECKPCDCEVDAYMLSEGYGVQLYNGPDEQFGTFMSTPGDLDEQYLFIRIIGFQDGWARIGNIENEGFTLSFNRDAWVRVAHLSTSVRGIGPAFPAWTEASASSKAIDRFAGESEGKILACKGKWVLLQGRTDAGESLTGWLEPDGQCPNPYTTCP